jgi:hypothetical protein
MRSVVGTDGGVRVFLMPPFFFEAANLRVSVRCADVREFAELERRVDSRFHTLATEKSRKDGARRIGWRTGV